MAALAQLNQPRGVAVGPDGAVYVADQRIRVIRNNQVSTLAGNGTAGFADGVSTQSKFYNPCGVAVGPDGAVYVADWSNHRVRVIRNNQVSTLAGNGTGGFADGVSTQSQFYNPVGVAVGPDGAVYVADQCNHRIRVIRNNQVSTLAGNGAAGYADGETVTKQALYADTVDLELARRVGCDLAVVINGVELGMHESFVQLRCPKLRQCSLRVQPVDLDSVANFHAYVYTDKIPDDLKPTQLLGLAYLLLAADVRPVGLALLARLQDYRSEASNALRELVQLYCYCLDLHPFDEGSRVVLYLLQEHKAMLAPELPNVPTWLGKHGDKLMELMQVLVNPAFDACPITTQMLTEKKGNFLSVRDTLERLYKERALGGDFEIKITGESQVFKAHAYVLYAMWPYFRAMYDANLKEKANSCLQLPAVGDDGGISPVVLALIIEYCYKSVIAPGDRVNASCALQILSIAELYLTNHVGDEKKAFEGLVALAQAQAANALTVDVCIDVFSQATRYGFEELAERARAMISSNIKTLLADPQRRNEIRSLAADVQLDLLWSCLAGQ